MKKDRSDMERAALLKQAAELEAMPDAEIDTSDAPEAASWAGAVRGRFYRPIKQQLTVRLDSDVVAWFKAAGEGYQTRINAALREYVESHSRS